jgi:gas vesicle protein
MSKKSGFGKLLAGVGIGVGLGLLLAPQSGEKTRKDLKNKANELIDELKEIDYNEVKDNLIERVQKLQSDLADLDKEKVLEIAEVKADEIKKSAEDIYKSAVKQGKPIIEKTAKELKNKTIEVLEGVIVKLKDEPEKLPKKKITKKVAE